MAFVNQSPRALQQIYTHPPLGPGPGSYDSLIRISNQRSCAPFLSTSSKLQYNKKQKSLSPGPGAYEISGREASPQEYLLQQEDKTRLISLKKPNCVFLSKVQRFDNEKSFVPGPGSYESRASLRHRDQLSKTHSLLRSNRDYSAIKGILQNHQRIPTIPDKDKKFGYTQGPAKRLIAIDRDHQKTLPKDHTIIPDVNQTMTSLMSSRKQKSCENVEKRFINYTKKIIQDEVIVPEPSSKNITDNETSTTIQSTGTLRRQPHFKNIKSTLSLREQETMHKILSEHEVAATPGPGSYYILGQKRAFKAQKFQFFGSSSLRFGNNSDIAIQTPDAQKQKIKFHPIMTENSKFRKFRNASNGFGNDKRELFPNLKRIWEIQPGPGSYEPEEQVVKKKMPAPIIPKEPRFKQRLDQVPPPGSYTKDDTIQEIIDQTVVPKRFKRIQPERFKAKQDEYKQNLSPMTYDLSKTQMAAKFKKPDAGAKFPPFGSLMERFGSEVKQDGIKENPLQQCECSKHEPDLKKRKGQKERMFINKSFLSTGARFSECPTSSSTVGPGKYGQVLNTLVKPSYNVKYRK